MTKMKIGWGFCGSFCTLSRSAEILKEITKDFDVLPIFSPAVQQTDTRFGKAEEITDGIEAICGNRAVRTIAEAEPLGPKNPLDLLLIAPCTGNTLAKLANGITDTAVTMAAKAHLRSGRPLVLALASNDALGANLTNIGTMLNRKNVYFVPMSQDDPKNKPSSLVADFGKIGETLAFAVKGRQIEPVFC